MPSSRHSRRDGSPHTAPTWYDWEDGRLLLSMDESRLRLRFMRRDPRVALTALDHENWSRHVSLLGRIGSIEEDVDLRDIDRLALRYTGERFRTRDRRRFSAWLDVEAWHAWEGYGRPGSPSSPNPRLSWMDQTPPKRFLILAPSNGPSAPRPGSGGSRPRVLGSQDVLTLLDWKRMIFALYEEIRNATDPRQAWDTWRSTRERLFRTHPQSPLSEERREAFSGCRYYDYDGEARVTAEVVPLEPKRREIVASTGVSYAFSRFARAEFVLYEERCTPELYWLEGYGGGVFLPFGDATSGETTYPAGRYLLDTVKGADLGTEGGRLVLDFNFAYNPSCAYDPKWVCPLAPSRNWLGVRVTAGEQTP